LRKDKARPGEEDLPLRNGDKEEKLAVRGSNVEVASGKAWPPKGKKANCSSAPKK